MISPLTQIRVIEVTTRCDLRCAYCVHPTMTRPKVDMSEAHWQAALGWVRHFVRAGTQGEIQLSGVGESMLHPDLPRFCAELRAVIGPSRPLLLTTNGKALMPALADALTPSAPQICVTAHHAALAAPAASILKARGLLRSISFDPVLYPQDWAGQVKWLHPTRAVVECAVLRHGLGYIAADGSLLTCCMDTRNESMIGAVMDAPGAVPLRVWRVCKACWQYPPSESLSVIRNPPCSSVRGHEGGIC